MTVTELIAELQKAVDSGQVQATAGVFIETRDADYALATIKAFCGNVVLMHAPRALGGFDASRLTADRNRPHETRRRFIDKKPVGNRRRKKA